MNTTPPGSPPGTPPDAPTVGGPHEDPHSHPHSHPHGGPRATGDEMRDLGRLRRSAYDRKVAGVAGGLARHLDVDPLVLRVAFVVLAFFGGAGLLLYAAGWLLVPDEATNQAPVSLDERSRTVALLIVGVLAAFALVGDSWGYFWFPWPLAIIAVVVLIFVTRKGRTVSPPGSGGSPFIPPHDAPAPETGAPYASATGWQAAPPTYTPAPPRPVARDPRRRGPKLFWFTVALITLGLGLLGMADVAGVHVADSAYPALAVGLTGTMLVVGSVYGRAGGLILLGLLSTIGLAGATAAEHWDGDQVTTTPTTSSDLDTSYEFGVGEYVLDLRQVSDLEGLDRKVVYVKGNFGRIEVLVPEDLGVEVAARIGGPGSIAVFGNQSEGVDTTVNRTRDAGIDAPTLVIDAQLSLGEIYVDTE